MTNKRPIGKGTAPVFISIKDTFVKSDDDDERSLDEYCSDEKGSQQKKKVKKEQSSSLASTYRKLVNEKQETTDYDLGLEVPVVGANQDQLLWAILNNQIKIAAAVAKLMAANKVSQDIIKHAVQQEFKPVTGEEEWDVFNEKLETDSTYRLVTKRMIASVMSPLGGINTSVRNALNMCLEKKFLLKTSWSGVNNTIKLKKSYFIALLIEVINETFEGASAIRVNEIISNYVLGKKKVDRKQKKKIKQENVEEME